MASHVSRTRTPEQRQRTCLRCDRRFLSAGADNRLCPTCRDRLASEPTPEPSWGRDGWRV